MVLLGRHRCEELEPPAGRGVVAGVRRPDPRAIDRREPWLAANLLVAVRRAARPARRLHLRHRVPSGLCPATAAPRRCWNAEIRGAGPCPAVLAWRSE